ncbi:MAG: hypothetical protein ACREQ9_00835, partial [Candidatus Binatia bacterium]
GRPLPALDKDLMTMLESFEGVTAHVDVLIARSGLPAHRALQVLLELELGGFVARHPGMFYSRRLP